VLHRYGDNLHVACNKLPIKWLFSALGMNVVLSAKASGDVTVQGATKSEPSKFFSLFFQQLFGILI